MTAAHYDSSGRLLVASLWGAIQEIPDNLVELAALPDPVVDSYLAFDVGLGVLEWVAVPGSTIPAVVQGDILYGSAVNVLSALAKSTSATRYLSNTGSSNNPAWAQVALTTGVTGTLPVANGGIGVATITGLMQGNGTAAVTGVSNSSTVGQVLRVTGAATYAWGALDLADSDAITGLLPDANLSTNVALLARDPQTFTGANLFTKTGAGSSSAIRMQSTNPTIAWMDSNAAANEKWYDITADAGQLLFRALDDTPGSAVVWLLVDRTGTAINAITLTTPGVGEIFTVIATFRVETAAPIFSLYETDAASGERHWMLFANNEQMRWGPATDGGAQTAFMTVERTASVTDSIAWTTAFTSFSGRDLAIGTTTAVGSVSGRTILTVSGSTDALIQLAVSTTRKAFFYFDGTNTAISTDTGNLSLGATGGQITALTAIANGTRGGFNIESASPGILFYESDQGSNEKGWVLGVNSKSLQLYTVTDAGAFVATVFSALAGSAGALTSFTITAPLIVNPDTDNQLEFIAGATGTNRATYVSWYRNGGATRRAYLGFATTNNNVLTFANEEANSIGIQHASGMTISLGSSVTSSTFQTANRGVAVLVSSTDVLFEWKLTAGGGTTIGYIYGVSTEFRINAFQSAFTIYANNTLALTLSTAQLLRLHAYGAGTLTTDASGNVTAVSDLRIKRDVRSFDRGLAELVALRPIRYGYTVDSGLDQTRDDYAGFSAQDVQGQIPEAVEADAQGLLGLSDRPIIAALVNAVRELSDRLRILEQPRNAA